MNNQTIEYHLSNISNNRYYLSHKKEIEDEIASLRATSFLFSGRPLGVQKEIEASILEKKLKQAESARMELPT